MAEMYNGVVAPPYRDVGVVAYFDCVDFTGIVLGIFSKKKKQPGARAKYLGPI